MGTGVVEGGLIAAVTRMEVTGERCVEVLENF